MIGLSSTLNERRIKAIGDMLSMSSMDLCAYYLRNRERAEKLRSQPPLLLSRLREVEWRRDRAEQVMTLRGVI